VQSLHQPRSGEPGGPGDEGWTVRPEPGGAALVSGRGGAQSHTFHGARPVAQISFKCRTSRYVSIGCHVPECW